MRLVADSRARRLPWWAWALGVLVVVAVALWLATMWGDDDRVLVLTPQDLRATLAEGDTVVVVGTVTELGADELAGDLARYDEFVQSNVIEATSVRPASTLERPGEELLEEVEAEVALPRLTEVEDVVVDDELVGSAVKVVGEVDEISRSAFILEQAED